MTAQTRFSRCYQHVLRVCLLSFLACPALAGPLHEAVKNGEIDPVKKLVGDGGDVNQTDDSGATPLHLAAFLGQTAIAEFLIEHGANVNAKNRLNGATPLHAAAQKGQLAVAEVLIAKGAEVNAKTNDKANDITPLHFAVLLRQKPLVELLVARGAEVNATDANQATPLHFAAFAGETSVAEFLIAKGADVDAKDKDGKTPLEWAVEHDRKEMMVLLKAKSDQ